jgi:hypothetical protein
MMRRRDGSRKAARGRSGRYASSLRVCRPRDRRTALRRLWRRHAGGTRDHAQHPLHHHDPRRKQPSRGETVHRLGMFAVTDDLARSGGPRQDSAQRNRTRQGSPIPASHSKSCLCWLPPGPTGVPRAARRLVAEFAAHRARDRLRVSSFDGTAVATSSRSASLARQPPPTEHLEHGDLVEPQRVVLSQLAVLVEHGGGRWWDRPIRKQSDLNRPGHAVTQIRELLRQPGPRCADRPLASAPDLPWHGAGIPEVVVRNAPSRRVGASS